MEPAPSLNLMRQILRADIAFLESAAISAVKNKRIKTEMSDNDRRGPGYGVHIPNQEKMVCHNLVMYGCDKSNDHKGDPREKYTYEVPNDPRGIMGSFVQYFKQNGFGTGSIFDENNGNIEVTELGIKICGCVDVIREGEGETDKRTVARKITGYFIEHFIIALPKGCFIETTSSRDIMCTPPNYHMESAKTIKGPLPDSKQIFSNENKILSYELPIDHITIQQLLIIDSLVKEALRISDKCQLTGVEVPNITRAYHWLRKNNLINNASSELNPDTPVGDQETAKIFEKLLVAVETVNAIEILLSGDAKKLNAQLAEYEFLEKKDIQKIQEISVKLTSPHEEKEVKEKIDKEEQSVVKEEKEKKNEDSSSEDDLEKYFLAKREKIEEKDRPIKEEKEKEKEEKLPESKGDKYADIKIRIIEDYYSPVALEENILEGYIIEAGRLLGFAEEKIALLKDGDNFEKLIKKIKELIKAPTATLDNRPFGGNDKPQGGGGSDPSSPQPSSDNANGTGSITGGTEKTSQTESSTEGNGTPPTQKESQSIEAKSLQSQHIVEVNSTVVKSDTSKPTSDETRQRSQSLPIKRQAWMVKAEVQLEKQVTEESQTGPSLRR